MKKIILLFLTSLLLTPLTYASHIVGGEISVSYAGTNQYNIKVRVYRDVINSPVLLPTSIDVGVYRIGTNDTLSIITIPLSFSSFLATDTCNTAPHLVKIEEGVYETSTPINIPNYPQGYYFHTRIYARSAIISNLQTPDNLGISFYAELADPSFGENSNPDFGEFPTAPYLFAIKTNTFSFPVTDKDGDSLVFSLVTPLDGQPIGFGNDLGTNAGSGNYPYYPKTNWNNGFSLANIVGGPSPMSINSKTSRNWRLTRLLSGGHVAPPSRSRTLLAQSPVRVLRSQSMAKQ